MTDLARRILADAGLGEPRVFVADWRQRAACRGVNPELFFPKRGADRRSVDHRASIARAVCALCPVRLACLAVALGAEDTHGLPLPRPSQLAGIWGGTNERERRVLRRQIAAGRPMADVVRSAPVPSAARHPAVIEAEAAERRAG